MEETPVIGAEQPTALVAEPIRPVAPLWHTIVLLLILIGTSISGAYSAHIVARSGHLMAQYAAQMAWEWVLFLYVVWGVRTRGITLRNLIGGRWERFEDFLLDVVLGVVGWLSCYAVAIVIALSIGLVKQPEAVRKARSAVEFLYPHTTPEVVLAVFLAITAGICEETIFRGYFQRQIGAWSKNAWVGVVAAALLFGGAHGYQTWWQMVLICFIGLVLGTLAHLRKSIRPSMLSHTLIDTVSLLVGRFVKI
jgi:membrane protease YdiL (CAAX protease family)